MKKKDTFPLPVVVAYTLYLGYGHTAIENGSVLNNIDHEMSRK